MKQIPLDEKLWTDQRGWSVALLEAAGVRADAVGNLHLASMQPGAVRGNHLHPAGTEWLLVFGGPLEMHWKKRDEPGVHIEKTDGTIPFLFEIAPGTAHTVINRSEQTGFLAAFSDQPSPETVRFELIKSTS